MNEEEYSFKIITVGNISVGKTSIFNKLIYGTFQDMVKPTIGINCLVKEMYLQDVKIKLNLFDTQGQEGNKSLPKIYFKNADCVLFVFAADDFKSFEDLKYWFNKFQDSRTNINEILLYLIKNKNDLVNNENNNDNVIFNNYAYKYNMIFKSISAKKDNSVNELFEEISEDLFENHKKLHFTKQKSVKLTRKKKKKRNCFN